jgi:predicted O-linked N-acetylglucosamine transferase (SPINDLY family)
MINKVSRPPYVSGLSVLQDAIALHQQGLLSHAEDLYKTILQSEPSNSSALHLLGVIALQTGQHKLAVELIDKAIEVNPNEASYYSNRGVALKELKLFDAAIISFGKAISLNPIYADAYSNKGIALKEIKLFDAAIASYDKAIYLNPNYADAYYNRGIALEKLKKFDAAIASYDKAISLNTKYSQAYSNRGNALKETQQLDQAVASYQKAISLNPDFAEAYYNLGISLEELKQFDAAIDSYDKAKSLKFEPDYFLGIRQHAKMLNCDWVNFSSIISELSLKIKSDSKVLECLPALALPLSLKLQRQVSETWSLDKFPFNPTLGPILKSSRQSKIRLGYYSADFRIHPVSILTVGMFEQHDKAEFELIAFSFGPDIHDEIRSRISCAFDRFIDVREMSDKEVALLSRTLGIDIAIDLGGYTKDSRTGIFSYRAAPIQLSYIGYLGTMGANYYDYLIADRTIIPTESQRFYSEKIVYLPFYQVNDNKQEVPCTALSREQLHLPKHGFVFCCFNANYKITPPTFDGWMRILKAAPGSVLLLYTDIQSAAKNLKKEAQNRGVDPERLIFGERLIRSQYLARCRTADLFLDTLPYNAGATASDALWAGLPVLTCLGEGFASRYAASLLIAIGLPELITKSQAEYEALAIELASNKVKLKAVKDKLERNRLTTQLFDTLSFTKNIEDAYRKMYERYHNNLLPDHINFDK